MAVSRLWVYYGPPGSLRNQNLFENCLRQHVAAHTDFLYLVVAALRQEQLSARFLECFPACFEMPVLTLPGLVRLLSKQLRLEKRILTSPEQLALLDEICSGIPRLGRDRKQLHGILPFIVQYISFLKHQNILDEQMLHLRYQKLGEKPGPFEEELIAIFRTYQKTLKSRGCEDMAGLYAEVHDALLNGLISLRKVFPDLKRLVVEGFVTFTPVERSLLASLFQEVPEVCCSLDTDPAEPEGDFLSKAIEPAREFFQLLNAEWRLVPRDSPPVTPLCVRPLNREQEVLWVADEIEKLSRENPGCDLSRMGIVCSRPDVYRDYVHEIFSRRRLPFNWLPAYSALESRFASFLMNYLRLLEGDFHRDDLFEFLSSPFCKSTGLSDSQLGSLERLSARMGIASGLNCWIHDFPERARQFLATRAQDRKGNFESEAAVNFEKDLQRFTRVLSRLKIPGKLDRERPAVEWLETVLKVCALWFRPAEGHNPDLRSQRLEALTLSSLSKVVEHSTIAAAPLPLASFRSWLRRELALLRNRPELDGPAISIGGVCEFQQCLFSHLFWLGFNEDEFPELPPQQIFFDEIRSSAWTFRHGEAVMAENHYQFYLMRHSAERRLVLLSARHSGASPLLPSPFYKYVETQPVMAASTFEVAAPFSDKGRENIERGVMAEALRRGKELSAFEGRLHDPLALAAIHFRLQKPVKVSPSQLEDYLRCGFRFFLRRFLKVEPFEEIEEEITPLERGDLFHRVLFRFYSDASEAATSGKTREQWLAQSRRRLAQILQEETAQLRFEGLFWRHEQMQMASGLEKRPPGLLDLFLESEWERMQEYVIHSLESHFGPLTLGEFKDRSGETVTVLLHGFVDRIDRSIDHRDEDSYFLIDYKTGAQDAYKRLAEGWGFQLPLYMWGAQQLLQSKVPAAGFYFLRLPLTARLKPVELKSETEKQKFLEYYRGKALRAVKQMYEGEFPVTLLDATGAGCGSCGFRSACRINPKKMQALKTQEAFLSDEGVLRGNSWIGPETQE
ncbi:MAG: PD-(D/E)XK nuclease family protein [Acidobacteria bacterium]|nr:PD-(D/E)XK nuclease family protein [Acidobacteriota bacterium]